MRVKEAKAAARRWAHQVGRHQPGFEGAYFAGSVTWLADDAPFPATSDVDVNVVLADPAAAQTRGKRAYEGVLVEASVIGRDALASPEAVLRDYHLAGGFRTPSVILDPGGWLTALNASVSERFAQRAWVVARCEHARSRLLERLDALAAPAPRHDHAMLLLFGAGIMTHVLLVAGLRNPTVRRRYVAARDLLAAHGRLEDHEPLLEAAGYAHLTRAQAERHLAALEPLFDAATTLKRTPVPFWSDVSAAARPVAIDGSRELIERGLHREAFYWIAATASRCQSILHADATREVRDRFNADYQALLDDLQIGSPAARLARAHRVREHVPHVWRVAMDLVATNPEIVP